MVIRRLRIISCLLSFVQLQTCLAVKFPSKNGITVDDGALKVGEFSSLSCNFIKWRQERISKVVWSISYKGVSSNVFTSFYETGNKESPSSRYFKVDPNSSGEKVIRMMLKDDRESDVNICCKVESVRDSGYGMLKRSDKEKCVAIPVLSGDTKTRIELEIGTEPVRVGQQVNYACKVKDGRSVDLAVSINGDEIHKTNRGESILQSNFTVLEQHFNQVSGNTGSHRRQDSEDHLTVECVARRGRVVLAKERIDVKRDNRYQHTTVNPQLSQQARKGRFYADPKFHSSHGDIPCHSYILLESYDGQGTQIKGDLPISIQGYISDLRLSGNSYQTAEDPIQVLNTLGYNGYRVVGFAAQNPRMSWTLEREYYEFH